MEPAGTRTREKAEVKEVFAPRFLRAPLDLSRSFIAFALCCLSAQ
jgi:hypothetical protein